MKTYYIYFLAVLLLSTSACISQNDFVRVDTSEVNVQKVKIASELADRMLTAQRNGEYYELKDKEATKEMIKGLGEAAQIKSYMSIRAIFGDYRDLKFDHMMQSVKGKQIGVYRFKGDFDSQKADVEIRVVLDDKDKLAGFFVRPWRERL